MNELAFIAAMYTAGIPMLLVFMFAEDDSNKNYKDFYFDNILLNKLNMFGRLCYYILTNFYLVYCYGWIILSWFVKLLFLKRSLSKIMSCKIKRMQSYTCNYELGNELKKRNFKYIHSDLLYYGSIGINLENKTFYPLAISIYPKFSDEKILSIIDELDNRNQQCYIFN